MRAHTDAAYGDNNRIVVIVYSRKRWCNRRWSKRTLSGHEAFVPQDVFAGGKPCMDAQVHALRLRSAGRAFQASQKPVDGALVVEHVVAREEQEPTLRSKIIP